MNKKNKKTFYITTPIYYPSGNLHIGHLYSTTLAWSIKNFKEKEGYDVKFLTGSDEHGQKIELKAKEFNMAPQEYVNMQTQKFIDFWKETKIDYDFFSRTTNKFHKKMVEEIFYKMLEKKFIYKDEYKGLYSVNDEEFIPESQAIKKGNEYFHPISNHKLEIIKEESYFFRMSMFSKWLIDYVDENPNFILPQHIWLELKNNFLNKNLEDLSITRISFKWGINVQKDPKHVIYVWLDALFNYISALGFDFQNPSNDFIKYWKNGDEIIHIVGKEITRFHCIYWPIFLHSLNIKLPTKIISHGWIVTPEGKMSKSKGNVVDPLVLLKKYDVEIVKYYLMSKINIYNDGIFSEELLINTYNSELANTIGNLISRTIAMIKKNFNKPVCFSKSENQHDVFLLNSIENRFNNYRNEFNNYEVDKAIEQAINLAKDCNKYIDLTMPWLLKKELLDRLEIILNNLLNGIYACLSMLEPIMPSFISKFKSILNINFLDFDNVLNFKKFDSIVVNNNEIVFPRFNID